MTGLATYQIPSSNATFSSLLAPYYTDATTHFHITQRQRDLHSFLARTLVCSDSQRRFRATHLMPKDFQEKISRVISFLEENSLIHYDNETHNSGTASLPCNFVLHKGSSLFSKISSLIELEGIKFKARLFKDQIFFFNREELYEHLFNTYTEYFEVDKAICYFQRGFNPTAFDLDEEASGLTLILEKKNFACLKDVTFEKDAFGTTQMYLKSEARDYSNLKAVAILLAREEFEPQGFIMDYVIDEPSKSESSLTCTLAFIPYPSARVDITTSMHVVKFNVDMDLNSGLITSSFSATAQLHICANPSYEALAAKKVETLAKPSLPLISSPPLAAEKPAVENYSPAPIPTIQKGKNKKKSKGIVLSDLKTKEKQIHNVSKQKIKKK